MPFRPTERQCEAIKLLNGPAQDILLQGGSRSGKTTLIVYWCLCICLKYPGARVLIARFHLSELKISVINDTLPKVCRMIGLEDYFNKHFNNNHYVLKFPNGSQLWLGGLSDKKQSEKILGTEFAAIYFGEITQLSYETYELTATRLAQVVGTFKNRIFLDCNPSEKTHWAYWLFVKKHDPKDKTPKKNTEDYACLTMNPIDNPHLSPNYLKRLDNQSMRNRQRFKEGKWLDNIEGALWKQELIDSNRQAPMAIEEFDKIIIGVDPAVSAHPKKSDETGIVVVGLKDKMGYVIKDASGIYTPDGWGQKVVSLYKQYNAAIIVAETNNGGDLVIANMTHVDRRIRVKKIHAKKGKVLRADPIVGLYERGEVQHLGLFKNLEEQMTTWVPKPSQDSPDRIDALVYALQELMAPNNTPSVHRL